MYNISPFGTNYILFVWFDFSFINIILYYIIRCVYVSITVTVAGTTIRPWSVLDVRVRASYNRTWCAHGRGDIAANYGYRDNETVVSGGSGGGVPLNGRGPWRARRWRRAGGDDDLCNCKSSSSSSSNGSSECRRRLERLRPGRSGGTGGGKGQEKLLLFLRWRRRRRLRLRHPSVSPWKQTRVNQNKLTCGLVPGYCGGPYIRVIHTTHVYIYCGCVCVCTRTPIASTNVLGDYPKRDNFVL